jgi:hypothetical protein
MTTIEFKDFATKVAAYVKDTDEVIQQLRSEKTELEKAASLSKTASAKPAIDPVAVETTVEKIVRAGFLKQADREQAIRAITDDPATSLLGFIEKLAERRIESEATGRVPSLGHAVTKEGKESGSAPAVRESDKLFEQRFNSLQAR